MSEYTKKLHYIKGGVTKDITLYTDKSEASDPALCIKDAAVSPNVTVYGALGDVTDGDASDLRVLYNGTTYAVLKEVGGAVGLMLTATGGGYGTWQYYDKATLKSIFSSYDPVLNNNSWADISRAAQLGIAPLIWNVGDCKEITLNGNIGSTFTANNLTLCVFILGFNHPVNGTADNNIIFGGFKTALTNGVDVALVGSVYNTTPSSGTITFSMNHSYQASYSSSNGYLGTNYGGWKGTDLRYDILGATSTAPSEYNQLKSTSNVGYDATAATLTNPKANTLLAALPSDFRSVLRLWTRWVDNKGNVSDTNANVTACVDAISLLTEAEVFASRSNANQYEYNHNSQLAYYAAGNSVKKKEQKESSRTNSNALWWMSSPSYLNNTGYCNVGDNGTVSRSSGYQPFALAPAFKV